MKKVIMILGLKRSGKDYTGDLLAQELNCGTYAFANDIKTIIAGTFGITENELDKMKNDPDYSVLINHSDHPDKSIKELSFRKIIQEFGQTIKSIYNEEFWSTRLLENILNSDDEYAVITDTRYHVEIDTISKYCDVSTVRIINNDLKNTDLHSSEQELKDYKCDVELDNTGYSLTKNDIKSYIESNIKSY